MPSTATSRPATHFAEFTFDPETREIFQNGIKLKLQGQPVEILAILLKHPGRVVSRTEIEQRLWPDGTVVEYEHSLNAAIARLREALGDDSEAPKYIETVPRRGYRFIAAVEGAKADLGQPRSVWRPRVVATVVAILLLAAAGMGAWLWHRARQPKLTQRDTILVADFVNRTGDPVFDGTLRQGLQIQLEQSPFLNLLPESSIQRTLRLMNRPADAPVTAAVAREVCTRQNAKALIIGEIAALGRDYVITLSAIACATGDSFAGVQVEATEKERVLAAVSDGATRLRRRLGESLASIEKLNKPLEEATTSSLEALKQFSEGVELERRGQYLKALPCYKRAVELDPSFARAYLAIAMLHSNVFNTPTEARPYYAKAFELRDRVSERERFLILGRYYTNGTGEIGKATEAIESCVRTYPRDIYCLNTLGNLARLGGEYDKAAGFYEQVVRIDPVQFGLFNLALTYETLNRLDEAKTVLRQMAAKGMAGSGTSGMLFEITVLQGDPNAGQVYEELLRNGGFHTAAAASWHSGKVRQAIELAQRSIETDKSKINSELAASEIAEIAAAEAQIGNCSRVRPWIDEALSLHRKGSLKLAAYVFAWCGQTGRAAEMMHELATAWPLGTLENSVTIPNVLATIETRRGNVKGAIEWLRRGERFETGDGTHFEYFITMYSRGMAYLRVRDGSAAAREFNKVLANRSIAPFSIFHALSYLQLGRAYVLAGDNQKARSAYQDFLTLWKDADPDIPVLIQAKREFAALSNPAH